jgi:allatostatin receptor
MADVKKVSHFLDTNISDALSESHRSDESDCLTTDAVYDIYRILVPTLFAIIVFFGSIGNGLVIFVMAAQPKLRTVTNLLLLNLAVSDLFFLVVCGSFSVVHYVLSEWPLGSTLCRIIQYLLYVSSYVTVYTLVAISVVRYICVVHGVQTPFMQNRRLVLGLILVIWIVILLCKIPILLVHGVTYNPATKRLECIITGKLEGQNLFASFFVFAYVLPLVIIGTLYVLIVCHLRSHNPLPEREAEERHRQSHVTRILAILVLTFAVCWLPLHLHLLAAYYASIPESLIYKILLIVWHCLAYLNSLLNPIIYNFFSHDFRLAFRETIWCLKKNAPPVVAV